MNPFKKPLRFSFHETNLDLENPKPLGGPNRSNSSNISIGPYQTPRSSNMFGFKFSNSGLALRNKEGKVVTTQLQQYTPKASYMDSLRGKFFDI